MNVEDTRLLIQDIKELLLEDYFYNKKEKETDVKLLLQHIINLKKEGKIKELLEEILWEIDIKPTEFICQILLVAAAMSQDF